MKKIIGYKLIKPEYKEAALKISCAFKNWENVLAKYDIAITQTKYINSLKEAGVLDLWFEPVYENEFKVGNWVRIVKSCSSSFNKSGDVKQINKLEYIKLSDYDEEVMGASFDKEEYSSDWEAINDLELATEDEILGALISKIKEEKGIELGSRVVEKNSEGTVNSFLLFKRDKANGNESGFTLTWFEGNIEEKYQLGIKLKGGGTLSPYCKLQNICNVTINGYKPTFEKNLVNFGCAQIDIKLLQDLNIVFETQGYYLGNKELETVKIGSGVFTRDDIKKIVEYYEKHY
jgi:hypothetical protein